MKSPFIFKKIIYSSCIYLFICFFFSSCDSVDWSLLYAKQINTSTDVRRQNLRERVRQRVLKDTSTPCRDSKSCKSACEDIYLKAGDLNQCYNTGEDKIKRILEVFDILIAPDRSSELNDIDVNDFKFFLDIGWRGFFDLIDPSHRDEDGDRRDYDKEDLYAYDSETSRLVLEWIANKSEIAKAIASKDRNREIMRHLFCIYGEDALDDRLDDVIENIKKLANDGSRETGNSADDIVDFANGITGSANAVSGIRNLVDDGTRETGDNADDILDWADQIKTNTEDAVEGIKTLIDDGTRETGNSADDIIDFANVAGQIIGNADEVLQIVQSALAIFELADILGTKDNVSCHDNQAQILLGFANDGFDDVSFITYANSKEVDKAVDLAVDVVDQVCSEDSDNEQTCKNLHYCLALKYENLDRSIFSSYGFDSGSTVDCNLYIKR